MRRRVERGTGSTTLERAWTCAGSWARLATLAGGLLAVSSPLAAQEEPAWPREVDVEGGRLVVYQPQPESFEGNVLTGRAAAQFERDEGEPIFGTLWFTSQVDADADGGTALVRDVTVTRARWPDVNDASEAEVTEYLSGIFSQLEIPISYQRLSASLASAEVAREGVENFRNEPPAIVVREELAELLLYDGEPRAIPIPDTDLEHIANAPYVVIRDTRSGNVYLGGGKLWYQARDPLGPWSPIDAPPSEISDIVPPDTTSVPAPDPAPRIVTATEPTELVVTTGPATWEPIGNGDLLYVTNTETPIVRDVTARTLYLLASGRWYRSTSLEGPWEFIRPDNLPERFQEIPEDSDLAGVRVSVPGTQEAEDAVLDAQIPQTAAIDRSSATLEVEYDGDPQFVHIDGTEVEYAVNTGAQVLRIGGHYYAVDNGVWFEAGSATGPWTVADNVPSAQIQEIPPSEPVYNVTHVHVYDHTPEVVYVGYTPGYLWSFPYYGVPVYGTGWYYRPWWGPSFYYPRFPTWGFHTSYNPWTGWSMGFSWSVGFMHVGFTFGGGYGGYYRPGWGGRPWHGGYYPPGGYRRPIVINNNVNNINIGNRVNVGNNVNVGNRANLGNRAANQRNIYNRPEAVNRKASPATLDRARDQSRIRADRPAANRPNNVVSDREGNVFRQSPSGNWQSRENREWRDTRPATTPGQTRPQVRPQTPTTRPATRPAPAGVQRDMTARTRGTARTTRATQIRRPGGRRQ
ncbi:MAG TPA: hypothetical protein VK858_16560 [Longimicrobiales bacterium]|nr:hypothetical protein [Longimicrobiales bacterium]